MSDVVKIRKVDWTASDTNIIKYLGSSFTGMIRDGEGDIIYLRNSLWHRDDGPALIRPDNYKEFYLNGIFYQFKDWLKAIDADEVTKTYYRIIYG